MRTNLESFYVDAVLENQTRGRDVCHLTTVFRSVHNEGGGGRGGRGGGRGREGGREGREEREGEGEDGVGKQTEA
jgi:hypothetical protein